MQKDTIINRRPAVAGSFYPAGRDELIKELNELYTASVPSKNIDHIAAVISPHAGYVYSGNVAASAFNQLSKETVYDRVFIIGSSHHASFDGASIYCRGNFITPLGIAEVDIPFTRKLIADNPLIFMDAPEVQASEHSLEVQIPFLQFIYSDHLRIIPIVIGSQRTTTIKKIATALAPYFGGNNLFIISTDFSHYPDYKNACMVDQITANAVRSNSSAGFMKVLDSNENLDIPNLATSICGWTSILTLLYITENITGTAFHEIKYMNSGDVSFGDKGRVVGYHAMVVNVENGNPEKKEFSLSDQDKEKLLHIARTTIDEYLRNGKIPEIKPYNLSEKLLESAGAFVTLTKDGNLRGCIGLFQTDLPLYKVVQEMAVSAATRDYRFSRVEDDELRELEIEISVLTPMKRIQSIREIELGRHGIYIKKGNNSGTFLPQVAKQTGWSLEEFLGHCSRDKAGIGWDGWKNAEIYTYEAYVFAEK